MLSDENIFLNLIIQHIIFFAIEKSYPQVKKNKLQIILQKSFIIISFFIKLFFKKIISFHLIIFLKNYLKK